MPIRTLSEIFDISSDALCKSGAREDVARIMAASISDAEADGIRLIGLAYLPVYCRHLLCGKVDGQAVPAFEDSAPGALWADARHGFCHSAFAAGEAAFYEKALMQGVASFGINRSYASGVLGWFAERMARAGFVGLAFSNASPTVAPFGGNRPVFGTNPIALGVPLEGRDPLVVDFSPAATTRLEIKKRRQAGRSIPLGWGLDAEGNPTEDPNEVLAGGTVAPMSGHKGSALALVVEILAAGLTGARWSFQASDLGTDDGGPPEIGQFFIAINPRSTEGFGFSTHVNTLLSQMTSQAGVRLPGEKRLEHRKQSEASGVEVPDDLWGQLLDFAGA